MIFISKWTTLYASKAKRRNSRSESFSFTCVLLSQISFDLWSFVFRKGTGCCGQECKIAVIYMFILRANGSGLKHKFFPARLQ